MKEGQRWMIKREDREDETEKERLRGRDRGGVMDRREGKSRDRDRKR